MRYRPNWRRIIFVAVLFHVIVISAASLIWSTPTAEIADDADLQEIEWIEADVEESPAIEEQQVEEVAEIFPEIEFPPIEIPPTPEPAIEDPPPEPPQATPPADSSAEKKDGDKEKAEEDSRGKIVVLVKVFPRDVVEQLIASGLLKERPILNSGKVVIAITVGLDGKMKNIEIRRGGGTDEKGNMINIVSEAAASGWVFAPYVDEEGNAKEIKTQIEFKPEDF